MQPSRLLWCHESGMMLDRELLPPCVSCRRLDDPPDWDGIAPSMATPQFVGGVCPARLAPEGES